MTNRRKATVLGILTSIATALTFIDIDALNWHLPSTYLKLIVIILPAIGGGASEISSKKQTPSATN